MGKRHDHHLAEEQLLAYADGELTRRDADATRAHLEACWSCRARLDELQETIHTVVRFLNEILLPSAPPLPWPDLSSRLQALDRDLEKRPAHRHARRALASWSSVLNPRSVFAAAAMLVVAAIVLGPRTTVVSAKELLTRADARLGATFHRRISLEERVPANGAVIARRQTDIWRDSRTGVKARRVFDERQQLLAGEWTASDSRKVYRRGAGASPVVDERYELKLDDLWRAEPSAADFALLIGRVDEAWVRESATEYVIKWQERSGGGADRLIAASLTLSRSSLHPIAQTLKASRGGEVHEFRFTETAFASVAAGAIPRGALQPDPELLRPLATAPAPATAARRPAPRRVSARELIQLEVDALRRLDRAGAFLGEQVALERDPQGRVLRINALVESAGRKAELLGALDSLATHRAVVVDIMTVAEAVSRQASRPAGLTTVKSVEVEIDTKPMLVHDDLRRYVVERLRRDAAPGEQAEPDEETVQGEIQAFTVAVLNRSLQARLHARALAQTVGRFSPEELRGLSEHPRRRWLRIVQQHASAFQRETASLRELLQPIFFPAPLPDDVDGDVLIATASDLSRATARLFEMGSSHDATIARTFSLSAEEPKPLPPAWGPFQRSLRAAERLAARMAEFGTTE